MSIITPHQPPAKTFAIQKLAATLPNSLAIRTRAAKNSTMQRNTTKHRGYTLLKACLSGVGISLLVRMCDCYLLLMFSNENTAPTSHSS